MGRTSNYYKQILQLLKQLQDNYPTHTIGMHISTALAEYGDMWAVSDKEFLFALQKYSSELELDIQHLASDEYVNKIVKDAEHLDTIFDEEDDDF